MSPLDIHYQRIEADSILAQASKKRRKKLNKTVNKAIRKDSVRALNKLTTVVDGERKIVPAPPVVTRVDHLISGEGRSRVEDFFSRYLESLPPHRASVLRQYNFVDIARKIVGVGSVGTRCLIVLLESPNGAPLFLQFKEATQSVLEQYAGASEYEQAGERVVRGQRLMQATGDILLGWSRYHHDDHAVDFYFRQLWDGKGSAEVDDMGPNRLKNYARHCGAALALTHARSGAAAAISGYLGNEKSVDRIFAAFAERYADLNDIDYAAHEAAIDSGRVAVRDTV